ncbi:MAG: glycosyltransferase [bacterium]
MNKAASSSSPSVSVVIPSLTRDQANLNRLKDTVIKSGLSLETLEIVAAIGVRPNGRARDVGTIQTSGDYLIFMDNDVSFPNPDDLSKLIQFLRSHDDVGLVGPAQQLPPSLSDDIKGKAFHLPRSGTESPDTFKESDMVTHACMALEREVFYEVGMEHPNLISGTDPDLRHRIRKLGLKVGLVPDTVVYHPPINNWHDLIRKNFRGGRRSRAVKRNYSDYHLPAEPDIQSPEETETLDTFTSKLTNHFSRFTQALSSGRFWWLTAQTSYLLGYSSEIIFPTEKVDPIPYPESPSPDSPEWDNFLNALRNEGRVEWLYPEPDGSSDTAPEGATQHQ